MNTPLLHDTTGRRGRLALILCLALAATTVAPGALVAAQGGGTDVPESSSAPIDLGTADPADRVEVNLVLAERDPDASKAYLAAMSDPTSPDYRHFLTAAESGARFGPTDQTLARIRAAVGAAGLDVVSMPAQRTRLVVGGSVAAMDAFLGTSIGTYQDSRTGVVYHASEADPVVPAALRDVVVGVTGLSRFLPVSAIDPADAPPPPARGLKPIDLAKAYDFQSLWDQGIDGTGTTVAILQFGVDTDEDLAVFDATFGIHGPLPTRIPVNGGLVGAPADFGTEATLDTQVVRAVAPGAQILVYGFPAATTFGAAMDAIVEDGKAQIVSVSYGKCYSGGYIGLDEVTEAQAALQRAAIAGVSLFAASGDWGAFSCHAFDKTDGHVSSFFPACTDNVVSVGGTFLEVRDDGSYLRETGWEDYLTTSGTGGGESRQRPGRPARSAARVPAGRGWDRPGERATAMPGCGRRRRLGHRLPAVLHRPGDGRGRMEDGRRHQRIRAVLGWRHGARAAAGGHGRHRQAGLPHAAAVPGRADPPRGVPRRHAGWQPRGSGGRGLGQGHRAWLAGCGGPVEGPHRGPGRHPQLSGSAGR